MKKKKKNKRGLILIISGLLLIAAALFLTGYNIWDNNRAKKEADNTVKVLMEELKVETESPKEEESSPVSVETEEPIEETVPEIPIYIRNPLMEMPIKTVDGIDYIGIIELPALDIVLPVASKCNDQILKSAPCRFYGSVYTDDIVIAAHNYDAHFGKITGLKTGDDVVFTDMDGNVFVYSVVGHETIDGNDVEGMISEGWDMTLFACNFSGDKRVAVRCEKAD